MINIINKLRVPTLFTRSLYRVGDDSHSDFKKINKPAPDANINEGNVLQAIDNWVHSNDVCLFMKGSPQQPQCGYSKQVVMALSNVGLKKYFSYNVLSNPVVRESLKTYSKWPTFPQLYVKGKLVGGCDIVREMSSDGSLEQMFRDNKLI